MIKDKLDLSKVDNYAISAHKFHGIKGIGVLYLKSRGTVHNITLVSQEDGLRSGTVNVAAAASLTALKLSQKSRSCKKIKHREFKGYDC